MQITHLDHYNIRVPVSMLESLGRFYREVLGLTVGPRPPFRSPGLWMYAGTDPILHLTAYEPLGTEPTAPATGHFSHVALKCRDLDRALASLRTHGVAFERDDVPELGQVQLFFTDPAGVGIELNFDTVRV